jgi:ATP/ADP translocase
MAVLQLRTVDSRAVFAWTLAPHITFFAVFAAVLLPNADLLQPTALAAQICTQLVSVCVCRRAALLCYWARLGPGLKAARHTSLAGP